jgi:putative endonuclease
MGRVESIVEALRQWLKQRWTSNRTLAPHLALGRQGESLAARTLKKRGYKILATNFRGRRGGEIDLVCRDRATDTLVFVEVKTRTDEAFGRPIDAVDKKKRRRIVRGAMAWLRMLDMPDVRFRFDVVEVIIDGGPEVRVIQNAFGLPSGYYY